MGDSSYCGTSEVAFVADLYARLFLPEHRRLRFCFFLCSREVKEQESYRDIFWNLVTRVLLVS